MYVYTQENASGIAVNGFKLHALRTQFEELLSAVSVDRLARQTYLPCKSLHVIVIPAAAATCSSDQERDMRRFPLVGHTAGAQHFPTRELCTSVVREEV